MGAEAKERGKVGSAIKKVKRRACTHAHTHTCTHREGKARSTLVMKMAQKRRRRSDREERRRDKRKGIHLSSAVCGSFPCGSSERAPLKEDYHRQRMAVADEGRAPEWAGGEEREIKGKVDFSKKGELVQVEAVGEERERERGRGEGIERARRRQRACVHACVSLCTKAKEEKKRNHTPNGDPDNITSTHTHTHTHIHQPHTPLSHG